MLGLKRHLRLLMGPPDTDSGNLSVLVLSICGNAIFLVLQFFQPAFPNETYIFLYAVLVFLSPIALGYTKSRFFTGVGVGICPLFIRGLWLGGLASPKEYTINIIQSGIFYGGLALPVAAAMFGIGLFARERRLRGEHARRFAWQALLALALTAVIIIIRLTTNLLSTGVVH